jgi:hypothetical protein
LLGKFVESEIYPDTPAILAGMSSEQTEERDEVVARDGSVTPEPPGIQPAPVVRERIISEPVTTANPPVVVTAPPEQERKETLVRKTNTNTGAIVAIIVGVLILLLGLFLVFTKVFPYLGYPWSVLAVLIVAIVLIAVGASLVRTRVSGTI